MCVFFFFFFFQAEDGIRDYKVTGVQTCALPISEARRIGLYLAASIARSQGPYQSGSRSPYSDMFLHREAGKRRW